MRAKVVLRLGDISRTSRSPVRVPDDTFAFSLEDNFSSFSTNVAERVDAPLAAQDQAAAREDDGLYVKPSQGAAQRDFVLLTADNFRERVGASLVQFNRRRKVVGSFVIEVFVFAARRGANHGPTIRRATVPRIAEAADAIARYVGERPDLRIGEIAQTHWAVTQARRPAGSDIELPTSATFLQLQHIDRLRAGVATPAPSPDRQALTVSLNGSSELTLTFSVKQLREILGLPQHNLLVDGVFNAFVPPQMPEEDLMDVDHSSDRDD